MADRAARAVRQVANLERTVHQFVQRPLEALRGVGPDERRAVGEQPELVLDDQRLPGAGLEVLALANPARPLRTGRAGARRALDCDTVTVELREPWIDDLATASFTKGVKRLARVRG